jgi:hypothetical protein
MKAGSFLPIAVLALTIAASAQDWQNCKPDGSHSFAELKDSVLRVTSTHGYTGLDEKMFNRSGDLVPLAIVQTLDDREMTSPQTLEEVLMILREAYACPARCVATSSDRQPRVALLLLEHLHNNTSGKMQSSVDETKEYIMQHGHSGE